MSRDGAFDDNRSTARQTQQLSDVATFDTLPCVIYECDLSLEIKYVSPNCRDLLELEPARLVGTKAFCQERVFRGDMEYVSENCAA
jgi:PAS domain-containing protein